MARKRATAIVKRNDEVLLVRERRSKRYSLPGGGVERDKDGGSSERAVVRELLEETGLRASRPEFLFHHQTRSINHSVYLISDFEGQLRARRREISDLRWWNGQVGLKLTSSTSEIFLRFGIQAYQEPEKGILRKAIGTVIPWLR